MHVPPCAVVQLAPSGILATAIGATSTATMACVLATPLPPWLCALLLASIVAWAVGALRTHALRRGGHCCVELRLAPNRLLAVTLADGRRLAGHLRSSTYVGAWLTTIVWRADGARRSRSVVIVADMLPAEDFRRLRVMLRYARSDEDVESPASQR